MQKEWVAIEIHMSNEIIYTKGKNTAFFHQSEAFSNSLSCTITE